MSSELGRDAWRLPPLDLGTCGPHADFPRLSDTEKAAVWREYRDGEPQRVPSTLAMNNRVLMLDPRFNTDGLTYAELFENPEAMLLGQLRAQYVMRSRYHLFCDLPTELPETWQVSAGFQNVYEAAGFGAPIECRPNDVPTTMPFLNDDNKRAIFDVDIDHPLELGVYRRGIDMTHAMRKLVEERTFFGRPIEVVPFVVYGSDGPLTGALNLRGPDIFKDMRRDPEYVHQLHDFLVAAATKRAEAFRTYWDEPEPDEVWLADDALANIGVAQYREFVLPYHRKWYDAMDPQRARIRGMHLCGDATRHFKTIHDELGVTSFDTGFPVDFAALRRELGPRVEISGGVEVPLLLDGTPERIYERARAVLTSGVLEGEVFVLHEANNLPPGVPWANLAAMYKAAFDFGQFGG